MSDGHDSGIAYHYIRQTLQDLDVTVNTVAIGEDTYQDLNEIALETRKKELFGHSMIPAYEMSWID